MSFGKRIKLLLQVKNAKQKDLAKFIGVNECVISRWTKDLRQPHIKYLTKICEFFGITLDVLMGKVAIVDELLQRYDESLIK